MDSETVYVELINGNNALNYFTVAISLFALAISVISALRNSGGLRYSKPTVHRLFGTLNILTNEGKSTPVYVGSEPESWILITIRVANPKPFPVSIFNINLTYGKQNILYFMKRELPDSYANVKFHFMPESIDGVTYGITPPESDYIVIPTGGFTHFDILFKEIRWDDSVMVFQLNYRDSLPTIFPRRMNILNGSFMRHRVKSYKFTRREILSGTFLPFSLNNDKNVNDDTQ